MKNSIPIPITLSNGNEKRHLLTIPYQGEKGDYLIKSMKRNLKKETTQQRKTSNNIYWKETRIIISNKRSNYI